jgi:uncharacterized protein (DUF2141 family)
VRNSNLIALLILLLWSCANRIQPTGGPRDEDPPNLVASQPKHGQRNFQNQNVILIFDEYINVKNLKEQLIITPRIDGDYDYKINKTTLTLEFEEPFADSTTYTLNFREAVIDITEANPAENVLVAFSTGSLLDTLQISGSVTSLLTKAPIDEAIVGLYAEDDTLDIFSGPPYYFTQTNKAGNYVFNNIKDGNYRLYAFTDENKNLTCQSDRESYAFLSETINLDTAFMADTLNMQFLNIDTLKLTRTGSSGRYFNVFANKYLTNIKLQAANDSTIVYKYGEDHLGVKLYNTFLIQDSLQIFVDLQDSLGTIVRDTFYLEFKESTRKPDEFKTSIKQAIASLKNKIITGEINFDKPLRKLYLDSIVIKKDSLEKFYVFNQLKFEFDSLTNSLKYSIGLPQAILDTLKKRKEKPKADLASGPRLNKSKAAAYILSIPGNSFISVENDSSASMSAAIKFTSPEQTGLITGKVLTSYNSFVIQLLDNKMVLVKEQQNGSNYTFDEVKPGEYYIRILVDENENGKWEMADIRKNIPAEKVMLYHDESGNNKTVMRAKWEVSIDLSF